MTAFKNLSDGVTRLPKLYAELIEDLGPDDEAFIECTWECEVRVDVELGVTINVTKLQPFNLDFSNQTVINNELIIGHRIWQLGPRSVQ